jgi:hypothetical protein
MGEMSDSVVACRDGAGCDVLLHSAGGATARAEERFGWARSTR